METFRSTSNDGRREAGEIAGLKSQFQQRILPRWLAVVLMATLASVNGGCGSSKAPSVVTPGPSLPPCAGTGSTVALPPDFPSGFPLPPGTVITSNQRAVSGAIIVSGFAPMTFKDTVAFFQSKLPAAGYTLLEGDAEMDEAESTFSGHGYHGKWKVNGILNCPGAVTLGVSLSKT